MKKTNVTNTDQIVKKTPSSSSSLIKRIWHDYVGPHRGPVVFSVLFMIIVATTTAGLAYLLEPSIETMFSSKDVNSLIFWPCVILVTLLIQASASYAQAKSMNFVGQRIVADMQTDIVCNLITSDQARLSTTHSSSFISSILYDATLVRNAITDGIVGIGKNALSLIGLVGVMFYQDWQLAIIATCVFPFLISVTRKLGKRMRRATENSMDETETLTRLFSETLRGTQTVKIYQQEKTEIGRMASSVDRRVSFLMNGVKARIRTTLFTEIFTAFAIAGTMGFAGYRAFQDQMTVASFMSFLAAMLIAYQPARALSQLNVIINEGLAAATRIFSLLDVKSQINDPQSGQTLSLSKGTIRFEGAHFSYTDGTAALNGVDIEVPSGKTIAIVGPSGAGKSTIFNLIPRFYDLTQGRLTIDGQDVKDVTLESLRKTIAIVTQEPFLFDDTIRANIAYARTDASDDDIKQAAMTAAAHDFIENLPHGYDSVVGEQGTRLSGGQKQRIAIARAMLANAPILLLDEATSALDNESEQKVQGALHALKKGRTTVIIAHRLSTIQDADGIYVLDKGKVIESGTHKELLGRDGLYARLYQTQFSSDGEASPSLTAPPMGK